MNITGHNYNINSPTGPEIAWACLKLHTLRLTLIFRNGRFFCRCFCRFRQYKTKYKSLKKVLLPLTITLFTTPLFLISGFVLLRCVFVLLIVMLVTNVMSSFVLCVHWMFTDSTLTFCMHKHQLLSPPQMQKTFLLWVYSCTHYCVTHPGK